MTEELEQLLKNLKLRRMLSVYDEQLRVAEQTQVSYSEFVAGLLRSQWHDRQESALEWRIRRADMPDRWSLETFPWSRQPSVHRQARELGVCWRNRRGENGTCLRPLVEGVAERLSLSVHLRSESVRRNVRLAGRPLHPPVAESLGSLGRFID